MGYLDRPLRKQDLLFNEFNITLRDIDKKELNTYIEKLTLFKDFYFLNFYDDQRFPINLSFSINNFIFKLKKIKETIIDEIYKIIYYKDFSKINNIYNFIKEFKKDVKNIFKIKFLEDKENLKKIKLSKDEILFSFDFNIFLSLFVFLLFNNQDLKIYVSNKNLMIMFDIDQKNHKNIKEIVNLFINKNNEINNSYNNRDLFVKISDIKFEVLKDELSKSNRYKIVLSFKLPTGGYATTFIKHITPINPISSTKTKFIQFFD